ncbi:MAG: tetratricopeptide repeat protein [Bryobacteraceae bacterium]
MISSLRASPEVVERAQTLYHRTDYQASLRLLEQDPAPDAATYELTGKNYFMLDNYEKAVQLLEKARALAPSVSDYHLWLGRAYGRRAETEGWLLAGSRASKARQCFETAIALDPRNNEAMNDLFDYYLNAPGFLGGGLDKAEAIARRIEHERPAEYHHEMSLLADHKKQYADAVAHLRKAMEFAPNEVGRVLDLARYLAKLGHTEESEAVFSQAAKRWPGDPRVAFAQARFYVDSHRESELARQLLERYLNADLTPDDPPKQTAEKLLRQVASR